MEREESAKPYHDWNQRITDECYAPNAHARILDDKGYLRAVANNYSRISFNFGPTLLAWLAHSDPDTYQAIIAADTKSQARYSGHGSAIAQVYNHIIMPLASSRDKETEIIWGIRDFTARFGRRPEGMWLAETAVDYETLNLLAKHGILFTILSPEQIHRVQDPRTLQWHDVAPAALDTTRPYQVMLQGKRSITVFFYHAELSRAVAFEGLLNNGAYFASRLAGAFSGSAADSQLINIATDGESYGHHHRFGEMALAYALDVIDQAPDVALTNYGEYLSVNPPVWQAEILENTSWSCAHGIERWQSDCSCQSGLHPGWNQKWRAPLREAMDYLRDAAAPLISAEGGLWAKDFWAARDSYIDVILNRTPEQVDDFLKEHQRAPLTADGKVRALEVMELSRQLLLMYTSCGWFFDDIAGLESVQVMKYAARAIQLAEGLFDVPLSEMFTAILAKASSNDTGDSGRRIFAEQVLPRQLDLARVALHYSLIHVLTVEESLPLTQIYCYDVQLEGDRMWRAGTVKMASGRVRVQSQITLAQRSYVFAVLHLGDHNVTAGVQAGAEAERFDAVVNQAGQAFDTSDFPEVIRLLDQFFHGKTHSLRQLFRDEQETVIRQLVRDAFADAIQAHRQNYERTIPLMRFLKDMGQNIPDVFRGAAAIAIRTSLGEELTRDPARFDEIERWVQDAVEWDIWRDGQDLMDGFARFVKHLAGNVLLHPERVEGLADLARGVRIAYSLPMQIDLRTAQLAVFHIGQGRTVQHPGTLWNERLAQLERMLMIHSGEQDTH